jgi:hypothetical protein
MPNWLFNILRPSLNRYIIIGVILFVIGLFLTPFLIGFPIMTAGWLLGTFGVFYYYLNLIPGGRKILLKAKEYLRQWFGWYGKLFKELFKG